MPAANINSGRLRLLVLRVGSLQLSCHGVRWQGDDRADGVAVAALVADEWGSTLMRPLQKSCEFGRWGKKVRPGTVGKIEVD